MQGAPCGHPGLAGVRVDVRSIPMARSIIPMIQFSLRG